MSHPLARKALVGLAQSPPGDPRDGLPDAVADLVPSTLPAPRALLLRAGAWAVAAAAGASADRAAVADLPPACPPEPLTPTTPALTTLVRRLLADPQLLALATARLAAAGRVLAPGALVPALSQRDPAVRAALRPVLGARGRWLAALRADFRWALADGGADDADPAALDALVTAFEEGAAADRRAALAALRRRDPARARAALEGTFKGDAPADRAAFVEALAVGLGPGDEPFLEAALDDRAKAVRAAARDVLCLLPGGRLAARMAARADAVLVVSERPAAPRGFLSRVLRRDEQAPAPLALDVRLPEALADDWLADRLELDPPFARVGQRTWWAWQVLARVPPARWTTRFERGPAEVLALLHDDDHAPVVAALAEAAVRFGASDWARPLRIWLDSHQAVPGPDARSALTPLLPPLPDERLLAILTHPRVARVDYAATLGTATRPWSEDVGRAFLIGLRDFVRRVAADGPDTEGAFFYDLALPDAAVALPDALVPAVGDPLAWGALPYSPRARRLETALDAFARRVHLRHRLLTELSA